jgi:diguanylate cyclase (GGDEF)-like protein/putative nucleotidyltransferase with HDIG domain
MTNWAGLERRPKRYLLSIYLAGVILAMVCFAWYGGEYVRQWAFLTAAALAVATVSIKLPKASAVISMGDVLTILAVLHFGAGPALITYWVQVFVGGAAESYRRGGLRGVAYYKIFFNFAQCAVSVWGMHTTYRLISALALPDPAGLLAGLAGIASVWFILNTTSLSLGIALISKKPFWDIWTDAVGLYVLNFAGSAAAAGLISSVYHDHSAVLLLSLPIAAIVYQLYRFYVDRYQSAQTHIAELNRLYLQTVEALATAVDAKDRYTHGHIRRVQAYGVKLSELMGITDEKEVMAMRSGALLHDIGKIAIPEYILNKPTVLTESEFDKMKIHPSVGAEMLKGIDFPFPVEPLVKSHHERWDGRGYPDGLRGEEIPLSARILSLVDCYDALTTDRPYRSPMDREELVEFFERESGRAYDPAVVSTFIANLEVLEQVGAAVDPPDRDIWGIERNIGTPTENVRNFQNVQPVKVYGQAMAVEGGVQSELYSVFEFVRSSHSLRKADILAFMGIKLERLLQFDAAVFYMADMSRSVVIPEYVVGSQASLILRSGEISMDQKLSGWVAANNQALCNLPPFPDFLRYSDPKPDFEVSAIAPMNYRGTVIGAVALYRVQKDKFSDQEFRHLEIVAGQTAVALYGSHGHEGESVLFDELTGLPNGYQMYLMFDQVAMDAQRYDYPLSVFAFRVGGLAVLRRKYGPLTGGEVIRAVAAHLKGQVRDSDILVRYSEDQFLSLHVRMNRGQAESLQSRIQGELAKQRVVIRRGVDIPLDVSVGIAQFPEEGTKLEDLLSVAEWRLGEDEHLRSISKTVQFPS